MFIRMVWLLSIVCLPLVSLFQPLAWGATYYVATNGNDSNPGTMASPWATFAKSTSTMVSGDMLYIMDGVYHEQLTNIPSGIPGNYTKIYALHDHQVEIDGQGTLPAVGWEGLLNIDTRSWIEVRGLRMHNSSYSNSVCYISNSSNIIIRVSGFWDAGTYAHDFPINVNGGSNNILLEDVWAFGRGRYSILLFQTNNNTLRRTVTRWDSGAYAGQPNAGISVYQTSNSTLENNMTLDHNGQIVQPDHSGFYLPANLGHSDNNNFYGNIALNLPPYIPAVQYGAAGFHTDPASSQGDINNSFIDSVAVNTDSGFVLGGPTQGTLIKNGTFGSNYSYGIYNGGSATGTIIKNTALYKNTLFGVNNTGTAALTYDGDFGNTGGGYNGASCGTGCISSDPGFLYPTRVESSSAYKNVGEGGADIGANIIKRYQNGALTLTDLWPWPNEDWIKQDMCASVGVTRGFCSPGKTLTSYVWEYLGNTIPSAIYGGSKPPPVSTTGDFSISSAPASATVIPGNEGASTITVASTNSFNSAVGLTCAIAPVNAPVTCTLVPASVTPMANGTAISTLTSSTTAATPAGTYTVTVAGTSGALTHTTIYSLTVAGGSTIPPGTGGSPPPGTGGSPPPGTGGSPPPATSGGNTPSFTNGGSLSKGVAGCGMISHEAIGGMKTGHKAEMFGDLLLLSLLIVRLIRKKTRKWIAGTTQPQEIDFF